MPTDNKGRLITDATVAPQNITYPTDLKLLNAALVKSEELIDILYDSALHGPIKDRTYREVAPQQRKSQTQQEKYINPMVSSCDF